ncbi:MAG: sec-independent protein translocase protein TatA [Candidatus Latescibacterota bacterium]|jgi:sec-independent protein translocase protein TatA
MFGMGPTEMILILLVALLLFGAKRIPEIAQGLGKGITEFKRAVRDVQVEIEDVAEAPPPPAPSNQTETTKTQTEKQS